MVFRKVFLSSSFLYSAIFPNVTRCVSQPDSTVKHFTLIELMLFQCRDTYTEKVFRNQGAVPKKSLCKNDRHVLLLKMR
jgi:hypothetical protein